MPEDKPAATKGKGLDLGKLQDSLKKIPWWAYAGAGGAALALVYYIRKGQSGGTSSQGSTMTGVDEGLQLADLAGLPYESFDPGYHSDPYADQDKNPSDYDPDTVPPSGSPPPGPGPVDLPPPSPGTPPRPRTPGPVDLPPPSRGQPYWHAFHAWPAWDSTVGGLARHYGWGAERLYTYGNNKQIIDSDAHNHGIYRDEIDHVWPGERVQVPTPN